MQADLALRAALARVRRRWALVAGLRTANLGAALVAVIFALAVLFDRIVHPEGAALLAVPAAVAAIAAAVGVVVVLRSPRLPDDRQVARFIEERAAALGHALDDALVSAVAALEGTSPFRGALVDRAVRRLGQLDLDGVVPSSALRRSGFAALGSGAALAVAMALAVPGAERAIESARVRFFPGTVRLEVTPGNVRVKEGSPLRIRASLRGTNDSVRHVVPRLILTANGQRRDLSMSPTRGEYEYTLKTIDRSFTYQVTAETVQSPTYSVTALSPPRVTRIDVHYRYPAFTGLAPRDEQDGGDIYAPAGTRVRLSIYTDKPIAQGDLRLGGASTVPLAGSDDCKAEAEILLSKDDSYRIRLSDADGLESNGEPEYFIRLMDDRPPDVRILRPSADQPITPLEEVPIEARADDDYGIASFDLVYAVAGGSEHVVPFERVTGTNEQKVGTRLLPAEDLHVKPGDVITYYARARDVARGKPATLATSDIFFLEVKPFSEEFVAAQSQGGGGGGGDPQIESLIEAQKQIISSTWNVERRAQAGRSADDIKAIAEAQAEAKARAEHLAARSRRPRTRGAFPQRTAPEPQASREPADDPIAEAVDAMEKALQQLGADRTKDALAHEMAALNGLLRAQAEVRRRQVTQGANGSGSGGNRSEQDLSALFDKELQRDQRTRYENRPSVETRQEDEKKDSALDRIRELARRQEDLSQRQRELAQSNVSAEERKRQLETLTREQEELRRQLEDLARRAASGSNPPASKDPGATGRAGDLPGSKDPGPTGLASTGRAGSSDPAKSSADPASALRDASRHMRSAASELGQNDPARAAESSQEAANRLKQLEGTMAAPTPAGGGRPGDGKREAEARQLSQELEQTRAIRERLQRAEQQLRDAEPAQAGVRPGSDRGQTADLQRLRDAYQRELEQAQEALSRLSAGGSRGDWGATPEHHEYSRSAPGTQAFKQDRSDWESLRKNVEQSLERYEANISDRLTRARTDDRFSGGGSEQVPEAYRQIIAKYFESLARKQR